MKVFAFRSLSHHHFITLRNDSDEEVQENDENDELVEEPDHPNDNFHELGVVLVLGFCFKTPVDPFAVFWGTQISD